MTMTKPMTDEFNWGKKFTELQEKQGKLGTQKAIISRSFIAHAIDQATSKAREEERMRIKKQFLKISNASFFNELEYLLNQYYQVRPGVNNSLNQMRLSELVVSFHKELLQSLKKDK